jgi:hypothetical protein
MTAAAEAGRIHIERGAAFAKFLQLDSETSLNGWTSIGNVRSTALIPPGSRSDGIIRVGTKSLGLVKPEDCAEYSQWKLIWLPETDTDPNTRTENPG